MSTGDVKILILETSKKAFKLDINSDHGEKHWNNVEKIGEYLFKKTRADIKVIKLFARLHDIKRENEDYDIEHGLRASKFIEDLYNKKLLNVTERQLNQLMFACEHHSNSDIKSDDITIQVCWDADRLDLWRLGIMPDKELLNTGIAKEDKSIEFAKKLNL